MFAAIPAIEAAIRQNQSARPDAPQIGADRPADPWESTLLLAFAPEFHRR
ncbi:MAG: hypothetical protein QM711_18370 [Micropruina sp.]